MPIVYQGVSMDHFIHIDGELYWFLSNTSANKWSEPEFVKRMVNMKTTYQGDTYIITGTCVIRGGEGYYGDIILRCAKV